MSEPAHEWPPPVPEPDFEPTRPGRYVVAAAATMALALVAGAVAITVLVRTAEPADLSRVMVHEDLPTTHVAGDVDYDVTPPVGGPHADRWLACGVYDVAVPDENAVHALEHGTVWITYEPGSRQAETSTASQVSFRTRGSCRRTTDCPDPSSSPCGDASWSWTVSMTNASDSS